DLKRSLHTFKGGARLAGMMDIGDLSHEFESVLIEMGADVEVDQNFFRRLNNYQDRLHLLVDRARARLAGEPLPPLDNSVLAASTASVQDSAPSVQSHSAPDAHTGSAYATGPPQSRAPTHAHRHRAE